jgi:hypothetical protein
MGGVGRGQKMVQEAGTAQNRLVGRREQLRIQLAASSGMMKSWEVVWSPHRLSMLVTECPSARAQLLQGTGSKEGVLWNTGVAVWKYIQPPPLTNRGAILSLGSESEKQGSPRGWLEDSILLKEATLTREHSRQVWWAEPQRDSEREQEMQGAL